MSARDASGDRPPAIVAPVMRLLGVTDTARSIAFYRDVLGFEVHRVEERPGGAPVVEVAYGPARIRFGSHGFAPGDWNERRRPGSAIVFFQTDDVAAMHAHIRARGGAPTEPEQVNWIKVRMFQVRDPDGHALWFGQSYDEPDAPAAGSMFRQVMPELPLDDVPAGVAYYRDVLGFRVNYAQADIGVMDRDAVRLLLIARTERHTGIGSAFAYVEDADALYAELRAKGADVQGEPVSQPWGIREFRVLDLEGNRLTFGQTFE